MSLVAILYSYWIVTLALLAAIDPLSQCLVVLSCIVLWTAFGFLASYADVLPNTIQSMYSAFLGNWLNLDSHSTVFLPAEWAQCPL